MARRRLGDHFTDGAKGKLLREKLADVATLVPRAPVNVKCEQALNLRSAWGCCINMGDLPPCSSRSLGWQDACPKAKVESVTKMCQTPC